MQPCAERWRWGVDLPTALLLSLAATIGAWLLRSVLVTSDPWHYAQSALYFGEHEWIPAGLTRWGISLPLVGVARIFGDTLPTYYAFALAATALLAPVVYVLARWVVGRFSAVLAVVCLMAMPLVVLNSSRGYPDLMAVALNGATLIAVLVARDRQWPWLVVVAGLLAGWAFEVRETTVFTWPVFVWVIWGLRARWLGYALVLLGLLPWAVADVILSARVLGDPLAKWHVLSTSDLNNSTSVLDGAYLGHDRWWYVTRLPLAILEQPWGWSLLLVTGLGLVGGLVLRGRVGLYVVWALLPVAMLLLQAGVLDPAHPSVRVDVPRYWLAFLPGVTIAAVALLDRAARASRLPSWAGPLVLTAVVMLAGIQFASTEPSLYPNSGRLPYEVARALPADATVWTDGRTSRILPVYLNSAGRSVRIEDFTARGAHPRPGDYVLIFSDTDNTCEFCKLDYDLWRQAGNSLPLDDYQLVWTATDGKARLYRVEGGVGGRA